MERTLTALAAAWCLVSAVGLGILYLRYRLSPNTGGSDYVIANSMLTVVLAIVASAATVIATVYIVRNRIPDDSLRSVQIFDAVGTLIR